MYGKSTAYRNRYRLDDYDRGDARLIGSRMKRGIQMAGALD